MPGTAHEVYPNAASAVPPVALRNQLDDILSGERLTPVFQPIARIRHATLLGYEGLIRGPDDSPLHMPEALFRAARAAGRGIELEFACCRAILRRFAALGLPGKLFLNISPVALVASRDDHTGPPGWLAQAGIEPRCVVFEITEQHDESEGRHLIEAVAWYRAIGLRFAIDDLGEGCSSLGRWLDLRPEFIKTDRRLVRGIDGDPLRQQFIRSLCDMARVTGAQVVAEGIETEDELGYLAEQGISCGQGYYIARPGPAPAGALAPEVAHWLGGRAARPASPLSPGEADPSDDGRALRLLRRAPSVEPTVSNLAVSEFFHANPQWHTIPVVQQGIPVGVITRSALIERFAQPYQREIFGGKPCSLIMDDKPVIADMNTSLTALSRQLIQADGYGLVNDFIITSSGRYLGIGTSQDLLRALNDLQILAARHANPLTQLPGNVPIGRRIQRLLDQRETFVACYADLNHFKPFNDVFGYQRGDEIIQLTSRLLADSIDPERDFLGHIGGDDFLILFRSEDWEARCRAVLADFPGIVDGHMRASGPGGDFSQGYMAEDRVGHRRCYTLPSLSLGAVRVEPGAYDSHHQIARAATEAKAQAKKQGGNALFIDRRKAARLSRIV
ncbi:GGDEF domain-containing protein [Castellaniella sp. GW247-6E4]|uniref:GGDEF domain-containing protein n=1 Tax=Castellaniella sp. GW247-6E4 TaxID=3140380 RepID=UPI0033146A68